jgi:hypothetical protein
MESSCHEQEKRTWEWDMSKGGFMYLGPPVEY